jgi:hypothetical protein
VAGSVVVGMAVLAELFGSVCCAVLCLVTCKTAAALGSVIASVRGVSVLHAVETSYCSRLIFVKFETSISNGYILWVVSS